MRARKRSRIILPSVAGLLLEKEYIQIVGAMKHPKRPLVALLGGAKVSDKIQIIEKLVRVADQIVIGGAMANTFLAYNGMPVGKSKVEGDQVGSYTQHLRCYREKSFTEVSRQLFWYLPTDVAVAKNIERNSRT